MRSDVDHKLSAAKQACAATVQRHLDGFRADETAAAHDEFGTGFVVDLNMMLDLAIDHVLLAAANLRHIGCYPVDESAETGGVPHEMGDPRAPQLILGGQACHGWTRPADPTSLNDGDLLARPGQMPGKQFATLAAAKDDDVESFRLGHGFIPGELGGRRRRNLVRTGLRFAISGGGSRGWLLRSPRHGSPARNVRCRGNGRWRPECRA